MSILPPAPESATAPPPPPTPSGVATLMAASGEPFLIEVAGLIEYIEDQHAIRCDVCQMIEGPCQLVEYVNTISIAWLMDRVTRG